MHTLTSSVATLSNQSSRSAAIAMIVPALLLRAEGLGKNSFKEMSSRLLEMAAVEPLAFRSCVISLTEEQRSLLEGLLRSSGGLRKQADGDEFDNDAKPTIELRMDF
jgi:hypothetical protein